MTGLDLCLRIGNGEQLGLDTKMMGLSEFDACKDPYQGGVCKVRAKLPDAYPYKSGTIESVFGDGDIYGTKPHVVMAHSNDVFVQILKTAHLISQGYSGTIMVSLVPKDEGHVALMELSKWRLEGLDHLYAQAVQVRQWDNLTGKMKIANPQSSRLVWETCLKEFNSLSKVVLSLLFLHVTSFGFKCDWALTRWFYGPRVGLERAQKMVFIAAHVKLERRDFVKCGGEGRGDDE
ncbi:hypothetical protein PHJA_001146100 [Phtheirospermum japonicum]|uniref:Uncharacterized protein n=1 Tax=Phtheirospermum japonicum TaxID=374723 RepID=A0A830C1L3_9LAMI|nr:hypothetical protein PHJA_001146100 [Phtheirospermum japonicum]